jgi:hypothetical protein
MPPLRRMIAPTPTSGPDFGSNIPAVGVTEDDNANKVAAELPSLEEMDMEMACGRRCAQPQRRETAGRGGEEQQERARVGVYLRIVPARIRTTAGIDRDKTAAEVA